MEYYIMINCIYKMYTFLWYFRVAFSYFNIFMLVFQHFYTYICLYFVNIKNIMTFSTHCEQNLDHFCVSQARIILFGHWILSLLIFFLVSKLNDGTIGFTDIRVLIHFGTVHGTKSFMQDVASMLIENWTQIVPT